MGVVALAAAQIVTCKQATVGETPDAGDAAMSFCEWLFACENPFDEDFLSVDQCQRSEVFRHSVPESCAIANADFKGCLAQLSCEEAREAWPVVEPLITQSDAGVPDEAIPCAVELVFYATACGEFECSNGEKISRKNLCNRHIDCDDRSDEIGCPW